MLKNSVCGQSSSIAGLFAGSGFRGPDVLTPIMVERFSNTLFLECLETLIKEGRSVLCSPLPL